jgi:DNA-binding CsgD family transcriptional regulator
MRQREIASGRALAMTVSPLLRKAVREFRRSARQIRALSDYSLRMKRGRPKHADILTPREWEVLALLREGLTNEEISDRLGITFYTVKFHVSEILSKLGVSTRDEAVEVLAAGERRWLGLPSLPLLGALFHVKPARAMALGLTIVVAGAALTLFGAWPGWLSDGAGQSAQETSQTLEALTDFVAGPVNQAPQNSA